MSSTPTVTTILQTTDLKWYFQNITSGQRGLDVISELSGQSNHGGATKKPLYANNSPTHFHDDKGTSLPTGLYTILYPRTGEGEGSQDTLNRVYHSSEMCMFWGGSSPTANKYWQTLLTFHWHTGKAQNLMSMIISIESATPWKISINIP